MANISPEEMEKYGGRAYEAWAIWNNCQGVFTCSVRHRRSECEAELASYGPEAKIVPVVIAFDEANEYWHRHGIEDERERYR